MTVPGAEVTHEKSDLLDNARDFMSADLRRVLEEDTVTYSWRRKPKPEKTHDPSQAEEGMLHPAQDVVDMCAAPSTKWDSSCHASSQDNRGRGKSPATGVRFSEVSRPAKSASEDDKPLRPSMTSHSLVLAKRVAAGNSASRSGSRPGTAGRLDLEAAAEDLAQRLRSCACELDVGAKLVAYDGSVPCLKGSFLRHACGKPLQQWARGEISGKLACLYIDDWTQGDVSWPEAAGGDLEQLGMVAGLLADPLLQRSYTGELHRDTFTRTPTAVATDAVQRVVDAVKPGSGTVLVSEVEHQFSTLQANSISEGHAGRLRIAVFQELLHILWAKGSFSRPDQELGDSWLLGELHRSPEMLKKYAYAAPFGALQRENAFLDTYFVRMLKMKRTLSKLIDSWEKVDYYALLGVSQTATDKELRNAYRKACLRLHPDKGGDKAQFQLLQDAYANILEERAKKHPPQSSDKCGDGTASNMGTSASAGKDAAKASECRATLELTQGETQNLFAGATEEVLSAVRQMLHHANSVKQFMNQAEKADGHLQHLKQTKDGGIDTLHDAQEAVDALLRLSDQIGNLGPALGEAAMEVAEASLALAARFSAVPAAILLTDAALSCSFEASRMQHASKQLLEIRLDTTSTLQTLQMNLLMAKTIGTIDMETLQLSLGLVSKASRRVIIALRQVASAVEDAGQRVHQCSSHSASIASFAAGRAQADAAARCDDMVQAALPPTDNAGSASAPASAHEASPDDAASSSPRPSKPASAPPNAATGKQGAAGAVLEARMQNDKLLRQLNKELLELQSRARDHLQKPSGSSVWAGIPSEAYSQAFQLIAEILLMSTEAACTEIQTALVNAAGKDFLPMTLEVVLKHHFACVEACKSGLAMSVDLQTQLLRLGSLLDAQALISALQKGAKPRLVSCFDALPEERKVPLIATLDNYFELLCSAVVASRIV